jgi:hypothetical protein
MFSVIRFGRKILVLGDDFEESGRHSGLEINSLRRTEKTNIQSYASRAVV